jgi:hypothetical protein
MKSLFLITTTIAILVGPATHKAGACDLKRPSFELAGFPISPHQVALLGGANVEERSARPTLMLAGMPASPHQIAVLTPRSKAEKTVEASTGMTPELTSFDRARPSLPQRTTDAGLCIPD